MTPAEFLALVAQLPPHARRFRVGDMEVELGEPARATKVPTTAQAEAEHEAKKPAPKSDIDSLGEPPFDHSYDEVERGPDVLSAGDSEDTGS